MAHSRANDFSFPKRTIHLDFHTGPDIPDVGADFNAKEFARTFKNAHVDCVNVFAKCHHGLLYYDTDRPERHPGLARSLNLLEQQIEALHALDILAPIYLSVQCDEYATDTHPEWIALTPDLQQVKRTALPCPPGAAEPAFTAGWKILDMSSPYQDYLAEQLQEVLDKFAPVDGVILDMCWDQTSCSKWAMEGTLKQGYDPRLASDREKYAREVSHQYMQRYRDIFERGQKGERSLGLWFNSRPKTLLNFEKRFVHHVMVECLPTGGWGYSYFPYVARYVQSVAAELPLVSHTGRFYRSWGDNGGLKPEMALKYECCQIFSRQIANGIGDLLPPRGVPSPAVYDLIRRTYAYIEACEPYVKGGRLLSQIGVIVAPELGDRPTDAAYGAVCALQQLRHQFDIIPPDHDLADYDLVLVIEDVRIDHELKLRLQDYVDSGGALILSGRSAIDETRQPILGESGIDTAGESPYSHTFLHAAPKVSQGLADYGYVMYEPGFRMVPATPHAESLVAVGEPYFERDFTHFSGHEYTPEAGMSKYSAVVKNGNVITISVPLLEAYGRHASPNYRRLLGNCIDLLIPQPLIRDCGPSKLETTVVRAGDRTIVHLLAFSVERRAKDLDVAEDALPLVDMPISVKAAPPQRVYLVTDHTTSNAGEIAEVREMELDFEYRDGYAHSKVTVLGGHAMLVIE